MEDNFRCIASFTSPASYVINLRWPLQAFWVCGCLFLLRVYSEYFVGFLVRKAQILSVACTFDKEFIERIKKPFDSRSNQHQSDFVSVMDFLLFLILCFPSIEKWAGESPDGKDVLANGRTHPLRILICFSNLKPAFQCFGGKPGHLWDNLIFLIYCNVYLDHFQNKFSFSFPYLGIYAVCYTFPGTMSYRCFISQCGKLPFWSATCEKQCWK